MLITCVLKDGVVYLPTVAKTEAGFYMDREPVALVPVTNPDALRQALKRMLRAEAIQSCRRQNVTLFHHRCCRNTRE